MSSIVGGPAAERFRRGFHEEHVEELGFLVDQRRAYYDDSEISWLDVAELEARIEAHLAAMRVDVERALDVTQEVLPSDEADLVRGATLALLMLGEAPHHELVSNRLASTEGDLRSAMLDALRVAPRTLDPLVYEPAFDPATDDALRVDLLEIAGRRRAGAPDRLRELVVSGSPPVRAAAAIALAKRGARAVVDDLERALDVEEAASAVPLALAILDRDRARGALREIAASPSAAQPAAALALALAGSVEETASVEALLATDPERGAHALGLLGGLDGLRRLLELARTDDGAFAGTALERISGVASEDPDEHAAWLDSLPTGSETERWRRGEPWSARALLDELEASSTPLRIRHELALELNRSLGPSEFEADAWTSQQSAAIAAWRSRV